MAHHHHHRQEQLSHPAVDDLVNLLSKANHDLTVVHNRLEKEFQQIYPDNANPLKLVTRIKKIQEDLTSLKDQCRELLAAKQINSLVSKFPIVAMDTEFPGVVYRPSSGNPTDDKSLVHRLGPDDNYQVLKANVDNLKIIQVGLSLSDALGNMPDFNTDNCYIWEFNFCDFDIHNDYCAPDSIELLKRQGIDFEKNKRKGIDSVKFAEFLLHSKLVCNNKNYSGVTWATFHSAYDFGYLIKMLTGGRSLPYQLADFMKLVKCYFGTRVYDIKHVMKFQNNLYGGLERVAKTLDVEREVGKRHQAGSDSLLTLKTFLKLKEKAFITIGDNRYAGVLYGFDVKAQA